MKFLRDPAIPHIGIYPKRTGSKDSKKQILAHQCPYRIVQISQKVKTKQAKCPSIDKYMNKMCYIHTVEYYSAIKRDEILIHATT